MKKIFFISLTKKLIFISLEKNSILISLEQIICWYHLKKYVDLTWKNVSWSHLKKYFWSHLKKRKKLSYLKKASLLISPLSSSILSTAAGFRSTWEKSILRGLWSHEHFCCSCCGGVRQRLAQTFKYGNENASNSNRVLVAYLIPAGNSRPSNQ